MSKQSKSADDRGKGDSGIRLTFLRAFAPRAAEDRPSHEDEQEAARVADEALRTWGAIYDTYLAASEEMRRALADDPACDPRSVFDQRWAERHALRSSPERRWPRESIRAFLRVVGTASELEEQRAASQELATLAACGDRLFRRGRRGEARPDLTGAHRAMNRFVCAMAAEAGRLEDRLRGEGWEFHAESGELRKRRDGPGQRSPELTLAVHEVCERLQVAGNTLAIRDRIVTELRPSFPEEDLSTARGSRLYKAVSNYVQSRPPK